VPRRGAEFLSREISVTTRKSGAGKFSAENYCGSQEKRLFCYNYSMRKLLSFLWLAFLACALYGYFFHGSILQSTLETLTHASIYYAYAFLIILGVIRGFTLVPITYLIILGLLFLPPFPLLIIILIGALVSSASVYYFFEYLNLDTYFEKHHAKQVSTIKLALEKNELPIIVAWSAFPLLPTDIICYVCGSLEVDIKKMLLGIFIGEGVSCAIYIYFGSQILSHLRFVF
jgi:uncharacterized membrane protein YdjX (TVP38/TMEM64 family)